MSRELPPQPNLEYLKKKAKDLLPELRRANPAATLADALHALARDYGFRTWPMLKSHVESLLNAPASIADERSPFIGVWRANVATAKRHPDNLYRSAMLQFAVVDNVVTITDTVVDGSNREERSQNTLLVDGEDHPAAHGFLVTARWLGPRTLEAIVRKDGTLEGRVTYVVSPDGNTLTLSTGDQVAVFDRVASAR